MHKPGRNAPCACGSGRKYKHCCLESPGASASPGQAVMAELQRALGEGRSDSIEALQALTDQFMAERNRRPVDEFHGLAPEQMHARSATIFNTLDGAACRYYRYAGGIA